MPSSSSSVNEGVIELSGVLEIWGNISSSDFPSRIGCSGPSAPVEVVLTVNSRLRGLGRTGEYAWIMWGTYGFAIGNSFLVSIGVGVAGIGAEEDPESASSAGGIARMVGRRVEAGI